MRTRLLALFGAVFLAALTLYGVGAFGVGFASAQTTTPTKPAWFRPVTVDTQKAFDKIVKANTPQSRGILQRAIIRHAPRAGVAGVGAIGATGAAAGATVGVGAVLIYEIAYLPCWTCSPRSYFVNTELKPASGAIYANSAAQKKVEVQGVLSHYSFDQRNGSIQKGTVKATRIIRIVNAHADYNSTGQQRQCANGVSLTASGASGFNQVNYCSAYVTPPAVPENPTVPSVQQGSNPDAAVDTASNGAKVQGYTMNPADFSEREISKQLCPAYGTCKKSENFPLWDMSKSESATSGGPSPHKMTSTEGNAVINSVVADPEAPAVAPEEYPPQDPSDTEPAGDPTVPGGIPNPFEDPLGDPDKDGIPNKDDTDPEGDGDPDGDGNPNEHPVIYPDPAPDSDPEGDGDPDGDGSPDETKPVPNPDPYEDPVGDPDEDGIPNSDDPDPVNPTDPTTLPPENPYADPDADGIPNKDDPDDDNDGDPDTTDPEPQNPDVESPDTDGDGVPDHSDSDDDNDGTPDTEDPAPKDPNDNGDLDKDGILDPSDGDQDGDGIPDWEDVERRDKSAPVSPGEPAPNQDGDAVPDWSDPWPGNPHAPENPTQDADGDKVPDYKDPVISDPLVPMQPWPPGSPGDKPSNPGQPNIPPNPENPNYPTSPNRPAQPSDPTSTISPTSPISPTGPMPPGEAGGPPAAEETGTSCPIPRKSVVTVPSIKVGNVFPFNLVVWGFAALRQLHSEMPPPKFTLPVMGEIDFATMSPMFTASKVVITGLLMITMVLGWYTYIRGSEA